MCLFFFCAIETFWFRSKENQQRPPAHTIHTQSHQKNERFFELFDEFTMEYYLLEVWNRLRWNFAAAAAAINHIAGATELSNRIEYTENATMKSSRKQKNCESTDRDWSSAGSVDKSILVNFHLSPSIDSTTLDCTQYYTLPIPVFVCVCVWVVCVPATAVYKVKGKLEFLFLNIFITTYKQRTQ